MNINKGLVILSFLMGFSFFEAGAIEEQSQPPLLESSQSSKDNVSDRVIAKAKQKGRVVRIDFDDELLIKGKILGPSLFTLYQKRNVEFGRLIKPRKDFLPEMRATLGDIEK